MKEKKDFKGHPDYCTPLSEVMKECILSTPIKERMQKQEINNYVIQWDKDQKLLNTIKEKEVFFQEPTDEEMMEILNPIYVY